MRNFEIDILFHKRPRSGHGTVKFYSKLIYKITFTVYIARIAIKKHDEGGFIEQWNNIDVLWVPYASVCVYIHFVSSKSV